MTLHCSRCDAEIPQDARFCPECGQPAGQAATGATQRIATATSGPTCGVCGTPNPPGARFCVLCGQSLAGPAPAGGTALAPVGLPQPDALEPLPEPPREPNQLLMAGSGGLFLIGLGVLAVFNWWWPGILVLVGLTALVGSAGAGQPRAGLFGALWMLGLAALALTGWWWPGILFLVGIAALLSPLIKPGHQGRRRTRVRSRHR
jgi:predicted nucleic acid-binding Zn ribbon protein